MSNVRSYPIASNEVLASGKRLHNYGTSQCLMENLTINGNVQLLCLSLPEGKSSINIQEYIYI